MHAALGSTAHWGVLYPSPVQQDHLQTHQVETDVIHALQAFTASLWNLHKMNLLDTASVQKGTIVLREQVLIGGHAQLAHTVTGLACVVRSSAKTAMLVNSVMEETSHLQLISVRLVITAG